MKAQGQACEVLRLHAPHFNNGLELAVRFGKVSPWLCCSGCVLFFCFARGSWLYVMSKLYRHWQRVDCVWLDFCT